MFSVEDTIVAISTPLGRGAIGVVRLSGPDAASIAAQLTGRSEPFQPRHATFATVSLPLVSTSVPEPPRLRDQVVITHFAKPASYTARWLPAPKGTKLQPFDCDPETARLSVQYIKPRYK